MLDYLSRRFLFIFYSLLITVIFISGFFINENDLLSNSSLKNNPPDIHHLLGTDELGRDMLARTVRGLHFSLIAGIFGSFGGVVISVFLGIIAALFGKKTDYVISFFVDIFISMPHLIFLILISAAVGKGIYGVVLGISLTHWPVLARLLRNEVNSIKNLEYIKISESLGKSSFYIIKNHIMPIIIPHISVGFILLFPHAILHEASLTFLGFGLSAETPSVGSILSESVKHISLGHWWLTVFPGFFLIMLVYSFDGIGEFLKKRYLFSSGMNQNFGGQG